LISGLFDPATEFGARVALRLRDEPVIWLTTVGIDGTPHPNPVWFYWDGEEFLIYCQPTAHKLAHIQRRSRVSLHFEGAHELGGEVVVFNGMARIEPDTPRPNADFIAKYIRAIAGFGSTPEKYAEEYSVTVWVTPVKLRGF